MKIFPTLLVAFVFSLSTITLCQSALAHCEVPCGIYDDQRRFEDMLEDQETIAKGMGQIREMAGKSDPLSVNQTVRWICTKETHATNIQHTKTLLNCSGDHAQILDQATPPALLCVRLRPRVQN